MTYNKNEVTPEQMKAVDKWFKAGCPTLDQQKIKELEAEVERLKREEDRMSKLKYNYVHVQGLEGKIYNLQSKLTEAEEYAKEGWEWLSEALDALGVNDVFQIKGVESKLTRCVEALGVCYAQFQRLTLIHMDCDCWNCKTRIMVTQLLAELKENKS